MVRFLHDERVSHVGGPHLRLLPSGLLATGSWITSSSEKFLELEKLAVHAMKVGNYPSDIR